MDIVGATRKDKRTRAFFPPSSSSFFSEMENANEEIRACRAVLMRWTCRPSGSHVRILLPVFPSICCSVQRSRIISLQSILRSSKCLIFFSWPKFGIQYKDSFERVKFIRELAANIHGRLGGPKTIPEVCRVRAVSRLVYNGFWSIGVKPRPRQWRPPV